VLGLLVLAIFAQLLGIAPGLEYVSGAFPTHFHEAESGVLVSGLLVCLILTSFVSGKLRAIALTLLGAFMFYAGYRAVTTMNSGVPIQARAIWVGVSALLTVMLAWIVVGAVRQRVISLSNVLLSFLLACVGAFYLRFIPGLST
jgi:uncharacterized membrane-anchored protein